MYMYYIIILYPHSWYTAIASQQEVASVCLSQHQQSGLGTRRDHVQAERPSPPLASSRLLPVDARQFKVQWQGDPLKNEGELRLAYWSDAIIPQEWKVRIIIHVYQLDFVFLGHVNLKFLIFPPPPTPSPQRAWVWGYVQIKIECRGFSVAPVGMKWWKSLILFFFDNFAW